jgi:hypothetical protein
VAIQPNKPNSRVFLLLGVVLAALAFGGVLFALNQGKSSANTVSAVVAKTDISAGTPITADLVTTTQLPPAAAPVDIFHDPSQVVGKITSASVKANTPLVPALFSAPATTQTNANGTTTTLGPSLEYSIVKGYVALAIPAAVPAPPTSTGGNNCPQLNNFGLSAEQVAAGFYIQPGDHIDILVDPGNSGIRYSFQDLPVLRVGASGSAAAGAANVYIVEVPRNQAELLTELVTLRSVLKDAQGCVIPGPFAVKYVLRPQAEWGKMAPDGSGYTPNYQDAGNVPVPNKADTTVTPGSLDSLFGH